MPQSTVGYERVANWGVAALDEDAFVRDVLADQPEAPPYFAAMKRINRAGPRILGGLPLAIELTPAEFIRRAAAGSVVIDLRPTWQFAEGHIPGSLNLPAGSSMSRWAGWLLSNDADMYFVAADSDEAARAARALSLIGLERLGGWSPLTALSAWAHAGRALDVVAHTTAAELAPKVGRPGLAIVDVRTEAEWQAGHIEGALNIPLGSLPSRLAEIPTNSPVVLHCQGGTRAAIAASILLANGVRDVSTLRGGYREWTRRHEPATRP
jgi:hydroxyacylglutathione hydrolase